MKWQYLLLAVIAIPVIASVAIVLGLGYILLCIVEAIFLKHFVKPKEPEKPKGVSGLLLNLFKHENVTKRTASLNDAKRGT